ncbi:MAG: phosphoribosylanthranilate isomerase [Candidatus Methylomirabilales bacterium]
MIRVKICGVTNVFDALMCVEAGADALGFVFVEGTPRFTDPSVVEEIIRRLPPFVTTVGVFVNRSVEEVEEIANALPLSLVQLHGDERPEDCKALRIPFIKAFRVKGTGDLALLPRYPEAKAYLLDPFIPGKLGGTGQTLNWELAVKAKAYGRIILAGGLTPETVAEAVRIVKPYAVDVSSGVEASPGRKDPEKVRRFIKQAKEAL